MAVPEGVTTALGGLAAGLTAAWATPRLAAFLFGKGLATPNYRGAPVAYAGGIVLAASLLPPFLLLSSGASGGREGFVTALAVLFLAGWAGFLDDVAGGGEPKGLRGHAGAVAAGVLTSGSLKALAVTSAGVLGGTGLEGGPARWLLAAGLVALSANAVNSLDLRPGRAGKGFLAGWAALACGASALGLPLPGFFLPLGGAVIGYLPWDLRERTMLGDGGANLLGAGLGLAAAAVLPMEAQVPVLAALAAFHLLTERCSITRIIERNRFLRLLDDLGREGDRRKPAG